MGVKMFHLLTLVRHAVDIAVFTKAVHDVTRIRYEVTVAILRLPTSVAKTEIRRQLSEADAGCVQLAAITSYIADVHDAIVVAVDDLKRAEWVPLA